MGRGAIYTRNTYNAKGQLTRTQVDAETAATTMAPTLWGRKTVPQVTPKAISD